MSALSLLLLFACVTEDDPVSDDDSAQDSAQDSAVDDSSADCGPGEITLTGEAFPGRALTLRAARSAQWEVSGGTRSEEHTSELQSPLSRH
jgi:hypothetical protein